MFTQPHDPSHDQPFEGKCRKVSDDTYVIQGREFKLPCAVRDASTYFASFLVPAKRAREVIAGSDLEVAEVFPGKAMCSVAGIDYRDNDLGDYNEATVAFVCRGERGRSLPIVGTTLDFARGRVGAYLHWLPVTQDFTRDGGRLIWGFPKWVTDVEIANDGRRATTRLTDDGKHAFTLTVPTGGKRSFRDAEMHALSQRDGVVYKTPWVANGAGVRIALGGAKIELGDHPIADALRYLGLPKRAVMSGSIERFSGTFGIPLTRKVGESRFS